MSIFWNRKQWELVLDGHDRHQQLEVLKTCLESHQGCPTVVSEDLPFLLYPPITVIKIPQIPLLLPTLLPLASDQTVPLIYKQPGVHKPVHSMPKSRDSKLGLEHLYHVQEKRPIIRPLVPLLPQTAWEDLEVEEVFHSLNLEVEVALHHHDLVMLPMFHQRVIQVLWGALGVEVEFQGALAHLANLHPIDTVG